MLRVITIHHRAELIYPNQTNKFRHTYTESNLRTAFGPTFYIHLDVLASFVRRGKCSFKNPS